MIDTPALESVIGLLQKCRKKKDLEFAKCTYAQICCIGLETHSEVSNHIVPTFVESGSLSTAHQVFGKLVHCSEHSWTSLIVGHVEIGQFQQAFDLYKYMKDDGACPSSFTFVPLLRACGVLQEVERGREIHADIRCLGLVGTGVLAVGNTLISMYTKCGSLSEAQEAFEKLPTRDTISWNALIAGYSEHGYSREVLDYFKQLQQKGVSPDDTTFICVLRACGSLKYADVGQGIHTLITQTGFESYPLVGNTLIDVYAKCGLLLEAHKVFHGLPDPNVVSWNTYILGYVENEPSEQVLKVFEEMQNKGTTPSVVTFISLLKVCCSLGSIDKGLEIHTQITMKGCEGDPFIGSSLVDMYAKCGFLLDAQKVFDKLPVQGIVSWTALITGYTEHEEFDKVIACFKEMQSMNVCPDAFTFACILKACGSREALDEAQEVHTEILRKGFENDTFIGNTLVDTYVKCGSLSEALEIHFKLPDRNTVSWNALITGLSKHSASNEAMICLDRMRLDGISLNAITFVCALKSCGDLGDLDKGRELHSEVCKKGYEREPSVGNCLVGLYANCDSLAEARNIFNCLFHPDIVTWNILLTCYVELGHAEEALGCLEQMKSKNVPLDTITFVSVLKLCGSIAAIDIGRQIHMEITQKDVYGGSSLISMYAKCGSLLDARYSFDKLPVKDVVSWTELVMGYVEYGPCDKALECSELMQLEGISPDAVMFTCLLKACASLGAIEKGKGMHEEIMRKGLEAHLSIGNILIDMYGKCGLLLEAQQVFDRLPVKDVVSWTSLILGYAMKNDDNMVIQCFKDMRKQGVEPNATTFTCLLGSCSRAGLVLEGQEYFNLINKAYDIVPTADHYTCMINLFARSGRLHEAEKFLELMPFSLSEEMWRTLLTSCKIFGKPELGLRCFEKLLQLNSHYSASSVLLANTYSNVGSLKDASGIEELRKHTGASKKLATAKIELNQKVYEFVVGDMKSREILETLQVVSACIGKQGHVPNLDLILRPLGDDDEKEAASSEVTETYFSTLGGPLYASSPLPALCNSIAVH